MPQTEVALKRSSHGRLRGILVTGPANDAETAISKAASTGRLKLCRWIVYVVHNPVTNFVAVVNFFTVEKKCSEHEKFLTKLHIWSHFFMLAVKSMKDVFCVSWYTVLNMETKFWTSTFRLYNSIATLLEGMSHPLKLFLWDCCKMLHTSFPQTVQFTWNH